MCRCMDSRLDVAISSIDILVMNHMLGANTPLLRVQLQQGDVHVEHIVNSRICATAWLTVLMSSYNTRNAHWEPLPEEWRLAHGSA